MNTPDVIGELEPGQVFVFGSNVQGFHFGGAARVAFDLFGAVWGEGEGLFGVSYALPTMEGFQALSGAVARFLVFAASEPGLTFLVTRVGTGIAGHAVADVAPLFVGHPVNVVLPVEFDLINL